MEIYFRNETQKALYNHELRGQISDGMWENSSPFNHWVRPCNADVLIDAENPRRVGYRSRVYNFTDSELLTWVGDRMIAICNMVENGITDKRAFGYSDYIWPENKDIKVTVDLSMTPEQIQTALYSNYQVQRREEARDIFGSKEKFEAAKIGSYDMNKLRKELVDMKKIMNA